MVVKLLKLTTDSIKVMSEHQQISDSVEQVAKEIKKYNKKSDFAVLKELRDLCIRENMTIEMAKMYRNIGMYYFYANNLSKAVISMQLAVELLKWENCISLLVEYYSELGLVYYYNREYLYAKRYYDETEELISKDTGTKLQILFLHYYRYGVLLSCIREDESAKVKLEKALIFSDSERHTAMAIMNLGIVSKNQGDIKAALEYYDKAICILKDKDMNVKGSIYNNIAEAYKVLGQYRKALDYMDKAFKCIKDNDLSLKFIYFNTYVEIKVLMDDREPVFDKFLSLLAKAEDYRIHKNLIIEGISNVAKVGSRDADMLKRLGAAVAEIIKDNTYDNEDYLKGLKGCIQDIRKYQKELAN